MVDVIREKCSVTGKVIIGIGLDDFLKKWESHTKLVQEELNKQIKEEKKEEIIEKKKQDDVSNPKSTKIKKIIKKPVVKKKVKI